MLRDIVAEWGAETGLLSPDQPNKISRHMAEAKLRGLTRLLSRFPEFVSAAELAATEQFLDMAFGIYEHQDPTVNSADHKDGFGFAFVVQIRVSPHNLDYAGELVPFVPVMHYVPPELREAAMLGLPPFVTDTYTVNDRPGYLIIAPVFDCDARRQSRSDFVRTSRRTVQDAIDFARRLGACVIGLGGVLPSITRYGQAIAAGDAILTTGHGGTISLVMANIERALSRRDGGANPALGVLGLGSIGQAIAHEVITRYHGELPINVCDRDPAARRRFENSIQGLPDAHLIGVQAEASNLISQATIVVSAVAGRVDLDAHGAVKDRLDGHFFVDDSQPYSLSPRQVTDRGGSITWVVGHTGPGIVRHFFDYGTMVDRNHDVFGCEAEAAALTAELNSRVDHGLSTEDAFGQIADLAVRHAATNRDVKNITELFDRHGIGLAQPQTLQTTADEATTIDLTKQATRAETLGGADNRT